MELDFSNVLVIAAAFGGFVGGTLLSRSYWILTYKTYTTNVSNQYKKLLKKFGIEKNRNGAWEMRNENGIWIKKETG